MKLTNEIIRVIIRANRSNKIESVFQKRAFSSLWRFDGVSSSTFFSIKSSAP